MLKIVSNPLATRPARAALLMWQIGADGGFLPSPVQLDRMMLLVAERADVIVDFSRYGRERSCPSSTRARTSRSAAASPAPTSTPPIRRRRVR